MYDVNDKKSRLCPYSVFVCTFWFDGARSVYLYARWSVMGIVHFLGVAGVVCPSRVCVCVCVWIRVYFVIRV